LRVYLSYPKQELLNQFLKETEHLTFNYQEIGFTQHQMPEGYAHDYYHISLGKGDLIWQKAKTALSSWQHFPFSFTKIYPETTPIKTDETVVVMIHILGLWWRNSTKIVYSINENNRFGFAYGTLTEHAEQGEEAFWIEMDKDEQVTYHIKAFSKPKFWMARLAYPLTRMYQRKFARASLTQMKNICGA